MKLEEKCKRRCFEKCIQSFQYTCINYLIRRNICKHIHKIAQTYYKPKEKRNSDRDISEDTNDDINHNLLKESLDVLPRVSESKNNQAHSMVKTKLESILSYLDECKFSPEEDENIHKSLNKVLDICRNNITKEKCDIELKENRNINIRKKMKNN